MGRKSENKPKNYLGNFTDFTLNSGEGKSKTNKLLLILHRKARGLGSTKNNTKPSKIWGKSGKYRHESIQFHHSSLEC